MPPNEIDEVLKFDPGRSSVEESTPPNIINEVLKFDPGPAASGEFQQTNPEDTDFGWKEAFASAFKNIPESAIETGKTFLQPLTHPIQTMRSVSHLMAGTIEKAIPGEQSSGYEKNVDQLVDFFKGRYGSIENFKKTVAKDPVGILTDVAALVIPAGEAVKGAGTAGKVSQLARAGSTIEKFGASIEPLNLARKVATLPFKIVPEGIPSRLYRSGAKFSTTLTQKQRLALAKTALDNEIMPTVRGLNNLRDKVDELNLKIERMINDATKVPGQEIPIDDLFREFESLKVKALGESGEPIRAMKSFDAVENEIRKANKILERDKLSPIEAQKLKQTIYKELQSQYSKMMNRPARVEAKMAVARSAKESLEEIIPEIKKLNAEEGALIELNKALERTASRISNRDLMGIGVPIKATMGGVAGGYPGAVGGVVLGVLDTPIVKSKIAIVMNRLRKKGIKVKPSTALSRLLAVKAGEIKEETTQ